MQAHFFLALKMGTATKFTCVLGQNVHDAAPCTARRDLRYVRRL